jgi:hypothetical protein
MFGSPVGKQAPIIRIDTRAKLRAINGKQVAQQGVRSLHEPGWICAGAVRGRKNRIQSNVGTQKKIPRRTG